MPAQVTNYKCPSCTGPLHFVGASGKLECEYCGSSYDVAEIEALYAEKEKSAAEAQQQPAGDRAGSRSAVKTRCSMCQSSGCHRIPSPRAIRGSARVKLP